MQKSSFVKNTSWRAKRQIIPFFLLLCSLALADGQPFSVDGSAPIADPAESQMAAVANMKYRAVVEWLQNYLGARYSHFQRQITPKFAEQYILDYKLGRVPANRNLLQVTGHLDADSLKRWVRITESRGEGAATLHPLFVLTSELPGALITPSETSQRVHGGSSLAQGLLMMANNAIAKFSARVTAYDGQTLTLPQPPRSDADIRAMKDQLAAQTGTRPTNSVIWMHLTACEKDCTGARLNTYFFTLARGGARLALIRTDDLNLSAADLTRGERVRAALKGPTRQFQANLDEAVSAGTLFSAAEHLIIDGVENYQAYRNINDALEKLDYVTQRVVKRSEPKLIEYEILTSLTTEEIYRRLGAEKFASFQLTPIRLDSSTITMRYLAK